MDRIIIINGIPYICHKEYAMEVLNPNTNRTILHTIKDDMEKLIIKYEKEQKEKSNKLKTCNFTSIYDGHIVSVKYIELHTTIAIEVFYDKERKMTIYPNLIGIDSNHNQIWVSYFGVWYKACGDPNEILKYVEKTLKKKTTKEENKDPDLFNKNCIIPEDQMIDLLKTDANKKIKDVKVQKIEGTDKNDTKSYIKIPDLDLPENKALIYDPYRNKEIFIDIKEYTSNEKLFVYTNDDPLDLFKCKEILPMYVGVDEFGLNWAWLDGIWYLVHKTINKDQDKTEPIKVTATAKVQKLDTTDKNQRTWHVKSIKNQEDKKYIFLVKNIVVNMAKCIYSLDPINQKTNYPVHKIYIPKILNSFYTVLKLEAPNIDESAVDELTQIINFDDFFCYEFTKEQLRKHLIYLVFDHPYTKDLFSKLNISYNEMKNGIEVHDLNQDTNSLSNRSSGPDWKNKFIDLDALINNVVLECVKDAVAVE